MTEPRPELERVAPPGDGRGPGNRLRIAIALSAVLGVVVLAVALGSGPLRPPTGPTASRAASDAPVAGFATDGANGSIDPGTSSPNPGGANPGGSGRPATVPAPASGLIAAVADDGALSTVDPLSGATTSYPAPGVMFGFPAWSPDGSRIAVVGEGTDESAIYVFTVAPAGATPEPPTIVYRSSTRPPFYLYWTPDGGHISFLTTEEVGVALRIAPVDGIPTAGGSGPSAVLREGAPLFFDWVDPARVMIHVGSGPEAFVGELGLDGDPLQPGLSAGLVGNGIFRPAVVSHDDRFVAYVTGPPLSGSTPEAGDAIAVVARDRSTDRRIPVFGPTALLFDPTSDTLGTIAAVTPKPDVPTFPIGPLRLIDAASGEVRTLLAGSVVAFFWAPDGRTIAALTVGSADQIPVAEAPDPDGDGGPTARGSPDPIVLAGARMPSVVGPAAAGAAGVDVGLVFVDVSSGAVRSKRTVRLGDHFVGQLLPYFDQYALSHRLWSPDSTALLLPLVDPTGTDRLTVLPVDGGPPRPIAGGPKGFWSP